MRPFFRHYGAKYRLSRLLPEPTHKTIIEPFAGSACYSVMHGAGKDVILCDIDPQTAAIWQWLITASVSDIMALPPTLEEIKDVRLIDAPEPARWLVQTWLTPQGTRSHTRAPPSCLKLAQRHPSSFWGREIQKRIAEQVPLIRHWQVECAEWKSVCRYKATYVFDPPYHKNVNSYANNTYGKGSIKNVDFEELANVCKSLDGQVIVHEQEGATWLPFVTLREKAMTGYRKEGKAKMRHEVVWISDSTQRQGRLFC